MRKFLLSAASAAFVLCAAISCEQAFSSQTIDTSFKAPLAEGVADSIKIEIRIEYPKSGLKNSAMSNINKALTAELFGDEYATLQPDKAIEAYKDSRIAEYREDNLPLLEALDGEFAASMNWEDCTYGTVDGIHDNILSYTVTKYAYTGGAHGMTAVSAMNFDMKTGTLITEKDFFKEGYESALASRLSAHLPEALESPSDTAMLFNTDIGPNGNFRITDQGVTYIYNQYEIAPYAWGIIKVTVPWEELEGLY